MVDGDTVKHVYYGNGKVIEMFGIFVVVNFGRIFGVKTLPKDYVQVVKEGNHGLHNQAASEDCTEEMV
ncbi:MAG: hypothetical protein IBX72_14980 [Nitrospirae bacterium]|jgi:hypothetical protein|nr:hypothetical protein [Nitrospirota bacterium]